MTANEIGDLVNHQRLGNSIKAEANRLPQLGVEVHAQPITRTVLRVTLTLTANFEWVDRQCACARPRTRALILPHASSRRRCPRD